MDDIQAHIYIHVSVELNGFLAYYGLNGQSDIFVYRTDHKLQLIFLFCPYNPCNGQFSNLE